MGKNNVKRAARVRGELLHVAPRQHPQALHVILIILDVHRSREERVEEKGGRIYDHTIRHPADLDRYFADTREMFGI